MREKIKRVIRDLERCAKENEAEAAGLQTMECDSEGLLLSVHLNSARAESVAAEQRRMIKLLKREIA